MAGNREKDWGKKKKFREGQSEQILDDLFFHFIDLGKRLQPKIIIAENVKGLLLGEAKKYMTEILKAFENAGYKVAYKLLNASTMGVPQKRERVFFLAIRNDLFDKIDKVDLFGCEPFIDLEFNEGPIFYKYIEEKYILYGEKKVYPSCKKMWDKSEIGKIWIRPSGATAIGHYKCGPNMIVNTLIANEGGQGPYHYEICRTFSKREICLSGSYPIDYDFKTNKSSYLIGMSVPPIMMAQITDRVNEQWLNKIYLTGGINANLKSRPKGR